MSPQQRRYAPAGAMLHIFARGIRKYPIFGSESDRKLYLAMLAEVVEAFGWRLLAYCLMGNHVHLLVQTPRPNLSAGMQRLHGDYARQFNQLHGYCGHLFESRFGAGLAQDPSRVRDWGTYIALNPPLAGLVQDPRDWRWCSLPAALGQVEAPRWLDLDTFYSHFSDNGSDPCARFAALFEARLLLDRAGLSPIVPPTKKLAKLLEEERLLLEFARATARP